MQYDNLPKELRDNGKFCVWKYEPRKGKTKPGKVPYQISGKRAQSNNEYTFSNYSDAVAVVSHYDGLGLGIFRGFSAVDVDHCVNTDGTLTAIGQSIVAIFTGCYIEISPSGTGLRVIFKASGFQYDSAKYYINNSKLGVELLDTIFSLWFLALNNDFWRFFTVIGIYDNICSLSANLGAKLDAGFQINLIFFITILMNQFINP